jgi:hypothetical protein
MSVTSTFISICCVSAVLVGCSGRPVARDTRTASPAVPAAASHAQAPPVPTAEGTARASSPRPEAARSVTGTVLETMNASNYTYVRVKTDRDELWAAASRFNVAVGDRVSVSLDQPMENFHSQSLNRDFPVIYFASAIVRAVDAAAPSAAVERVSGGTTIETVWKSRRSLAGKSVTVRGTVVKFNGGILGVNWIHLQDGTGTPDDGSNDITVTSDMDARVGDVVTATGIVAIEKDLGSGYNYPVIIEHARLTRAADADAAPGGKR